MKQDFENGPAIERTETPHIYHVPIDTLATQKNTKKRHKQTEETFQIIPDLDTVQEILQFVFNHNRM